MTVIFLQNYSFSYDIFLLVQIKMNIVTRLRSRETTNVKQQFLYTSSILESLSAEPDIVVPIRNQVLPTISCLLRETENFFRLHTLPTAFHYRTLRLFETKDDSTLFYKKYVLVYGYTGDKEELHFNLIHKIQFMTDMSLQEGKTVE